MRSGQFIKQPSGHSAFIPAPLPPNPKLALSPAAMVLLSEADHTLGRLDGIATALPDPELFVSMYIRQEAVLSSRIEGTQSTLEDVLQSETDAKGNFPGDVEEVRNYIVAMNHGLRCLQELPLSLRLIREIHGKLLHGVRGSHLTRGIP